MANQSQAQTGNGASGNLWKLFAGFSFLLIVFAGIAALYLIPRDTQERPPRLIGDLWTVNVGDSTRIIYVTREDRAEVRSFDPEGSYRYDHSYSLYELHARDATSGDEVANTLIARIETTSADAANYKAYRTLPDGPGILGPVGEVLWLWNSGLEARDLRSLDVRFDSKALKTVNSSMGAAWPDDPSLTKVLAPLGDLVIKGLDARYYRVDVKSGSATPIEEAQLAALSPEPSKTAASAFSALDEEGRSLRNATSISSLCRKAVLNDGAWFGILNADERANLKPRLGFIEDWDYHNWFTSLTTTASTVYRGTYQLVADRTNSRRSIELAMDSVTPVTQEKFLMAGFLRRPGTARAWITDEPDAALFILHRESLSESSQWRISRIGIANGKIAWTSASGLIHLDLLTEGRGTIVFSGTRDASQLAEKRPDYLIFMNLNTGAVREINVATADVARKQ